jgi:hypothetical protein
MWDTYRRDKWLQAGLQLLPTFVGMGAGILSVLLSPVVNLHPQGFRGDINRAGSALGGLLSLFMILFAPIFGCKRLLKYCSPMLDILKSVPYASWMLSWLNKWWYGEADFDDLPSDPTELYNAVNRSAAADRLVDELEKVAQINKQFQEKQSPFKSNEAESPFVRSSEEAKEVLRKKKAMLKMDFVKQKCNDMQDIKGSIALQHLDHLQNLGREDADVARVGLGTLRSDKFTTIADKKEMAQEFYETFETDTSDLAKSYDTSPLDVHTTWMQLAPGWIPPPKKMENITNNRSEETVSSGGFPRFDDIKLKKQSISGTFRGMFRRVLGFVYDNFYEFDPFEDVDLKKECKTPEDFKNYRDVCLEHVQFGATIWWAKWKKWLLMAAVVAAGLCVTPKCLEYYHTDELLAEPQGKGKTKGRAQEARRAKRKRAGNNKNFVPSGSAEIDLEELFSDADDEYYREYGLQGYDDYQDKMREFVKDAYGLDDYTRGVQRNKYKIVRMKKQDLGIPSSPHLEDDSKLRKAIYAAKHRKISASALDVDRFIKEAKEAYSKVDLKMEIQSFKPNELAQGIYKIYVNGQYACTGTHVGSRLFVVVHALSEDSTAEYKAVNNYNTFKLRGQDIVLVNKEIAYFPVNGHASPFKVRSFKILEDASIVTVFGYGSGQDSEPDAIIGFASPLGWCNAETRSGDCTAPVLDKDGKIVGFWTHGNGRNFGKFEQITSEFIELASRGSERAPLHGGLAFQSRPHSLENW